MKNIIKNKTKLFTIIIVINIKYIIHNIKYLIDKYINSKYYKCNLMKNSIFY